MSKRTRISDTHQVGKNSQQPAPSLPKPLLEETSSSPSEIFGKLLSFRKSIDRAFDDSSQKRASLEAIGYLRQHGLVLECENPQGSHEIRGLVDKSLMHLFELVNTSVPTDPAMSHIQESEKANIHRGHSYILAITRHQEEGAANPNIENIKKILLEELGKFKSLDTYLAYMHISGEMIGIQINHGKHKGYIAAYCPNDGEEPFLFFKHVEHGQGNYPKNRVDYVKRALLDTGFFPSIEEKNHGACVIRAVAHKENDWRESFSKLVRLSRSVKNLDLVLRTDTMANRAAILFRDGVTNMEEALTYMESCRKNPDMHFVKLNEDEEKIIKRRIEDIGRIESYIEWAGRRHTTLRKAKDLNFSILEEATKLQFLIINRLREQRIVLKREVNSSFRQIRKQLLEMAEICDRRYPYGNNRAFVGKAGEMIDKFSSNISEISSWVLDENDCKQIMAMFADKGGKLALGDVETIEEIVRFLHSEIIGPPIFPVGMDRNDVMSDRPYFFDCMHLLAEKVLCFNIERREVSDNKIYELLRKVVKDVDNPFLLDEGRACATIGRDFAEISFPMGKHYAELDADIDEKNSCYSMNIRYFDTSYSHAQNRKRFIQSSLSSLGYDLREDKMQEYSHNQVVVASFNTQDRKKWENAFSETVRLMLSAQDLDMANIDSRSLEYLFNRGFTNLKWLLNDFNELAEAQGIEKADKYLNFIKWKSFGNGDKRAFTDLFLELLDYNPTKILPLVSHFSIEDLDMFTGYVIELELAAKGKRDRKKAGQYKRLGDKLDKLIREKENGE